MEIKNLIPYTKVLSGDTETPITLFKKYVGKDKGFLLESYDAENNKFSFISKNPRAILQGKDNEITIIEEDAIQVKRGKLLDMVKEYLDKYEIYNNTEYSFVGGAVGSISYDIIRQYEKLPNENKDVLDLPDVNLMIATELVIYNHLHSKIILLVLEEEGELCKEKATQKLTFIENEIKNSLLNTKDFTLKNHGKASTVKSNTSKEEYIKSVERAKRYIYEGDIFQVVLSQRWEIENEENPFEIYRRLRELNPSQYLFYINYGEYQVLGSSPEMLVKMQNGRVYTCPIAGTRKRGQDFEEDRLLAEDLLSDEKEKAEHVMLVDLARNDMGKVCKIGSVKLNEFMQVKNYSHVMHLVSTVEGESDEKKDAFDILSSMLPAGTLSGAPKVRAMEIIEELEREKRGVYGGAVGYFGFDGNLDMCIAIRMMVVKNKKAYIQAGAGIVADSIPEKEYEETQNKAKALIKILGGDIE
jgi:anthranilate synthase component 1